MRALLVLLLSVGMCGAQPQPKANAAPGGGPGLVWVNVNTKVYHCYGDRYYGKTKDGKYMKEADAKALGAHASRNQPCGLKGK